MAPNDDRTTFTVFASLVSVAAFLLAALAIVVVTTKDSGGGASAQAAGPVGVSLTEWKIGPATITAPKDGTLAVANDGNMAHNLTIEGGPATSDFQAGQSENLSLSGLATGTYSVLCSIPGHADSGMKGTLNVVEANTPGAGQVGGSQSAVGQGPSHEDYQAMDDAMIRSANDYLEAVVGSWGNTTEPNMFGGVGPLAVATKGRGNQELEPKILEDGTKEFELTAEIIDWEVEPGKVVEAWAFNGMVPAPQIHVQPNDKLRFVVHNKLPIYTDVHWHGITTPFPQDGLAPITQDPILPGETFTYEFTAPAQPELGMYHPHNHGNVAVVNGMMGMFQVGEIALPAGRTINGITIPNDIKPAQKIPMFLNDSGEIGLTLNGKSFPATDPIVTTVGDWTELTYQNQGLQIHPMHLHHMPQLVVAKDGWPLESPYWVDTLNVAPGERYTVLVHSTPDSVNVMAEPGATVPETLGIWAFHCHILTHAEGPQGLTGMVTTWIVKPQDAEEAVGNGQVANT